MASIAFPSAPDPDTKPSPFNTTSTWPPSPNSLVLTCAIPSTYWKDVESSPLPSTLTTSRTVPTGPEPVVHSMLLAEALPTAHAIPAIVTERPLDWKLDPEMTIASPPPAEPTLGTTEEMVGAEYATRVSRDEDDAVVPLTLTSTVRAPSVRPEASMLITHSTWVAFPLSTTHAFPSTCTTLAANLGSKPLDRVQDQGIVKLQAAGRHALPRNDDVHSVCPSSDSKSRFLFQRAFDGGAGDRRHLASGWPNVNLDLVLRVRRRVEVGPRQRNGVASARSCGLRERAEHRIVPCVEPIATRAGACPEYLGPPDRGHRIKGFLHLLGRSVGREAGLLALERNHELAAGQLRVLLHADRRRGSQARWVLDGEVREGSIAVS
eukprot:3920154-Rhodomonas_salina.2